MKKYMFIAVLLAVFMCSLSTVSAENTDQDKQNAVQLTEEQKSELSDLYREMFEKKKEIIEKKLEFGMITKEKADKMNEFIDEHLKMLEENNFMFRHHKKMKNPHHDH